MLSEQHLSAHKSFYLFDTQCHKGIWNVFKLDRETFIVLVVEKVRTIRIKKGKKEGHMRILYVCMSNDTHIVFTDQYWRTYATRTRG